MTVEQDQAGLLPEPPPPRPARRDAAIDAALRKFDGIEDPAPATQERPKRLWAGIQRPQLAAFASAMLLVVIGIPAALIGLRNQPAPERSEAPTATHQRFAPSAPQAPATPTAQPAPPANADAHPDLRKYQGADGGVAAENKPAAKIEAASTVQAPPAPPAAQAVEPPVAAAPPPPPPPPPPAPPALEVASDQAPHNLIVTGSLAPAAKSRAQNEEGALADRIAPQNSYGAFLSQLQAAVRSNDTDRVIPLIDFPLRVNGPGGSRFYRDARSVERDFDRIFTPKVRRAILGQRADKLFVRDQGAMIGDGEVWFDATCPNRSCTPTGPVRIRAINP